jgi:protein-S-isoprenylcysteine O-methyltransferase Ste14
LELARNGTLLQRFRVPLGFLFSAVFLIFATPGLLMLAIGGSISIIGLLIRAWSSGHIRKNQTLAISGPYAHTRNPLYLGSFIMGLGFTIASGVWWLSIIFAILFLGIYFPVMKAESKELIEIFGNEYENYANQVPLLIPRLTGFRDKNSSTNKFDFNLYLKYREYRAALGVIFAWCILAAKTFFLK